MLTLLLRRARAQWGLALSVTALVALAATLLGVCALLLGPTQDLAFTRGVQRSDPQELAVDAFLVDLAADDADGVGDVAAGQLRDVLRGLDPSVSAVVTSRMRELESPAGAGLAYLAAGDGIAPHAQIVSGRWPEPPGSLPESGLAETAVPVAAAERLGLAVGTRVTLGRATGIGGSVEPVSLVVVGTYRASSPSGWDADPLRGAGYQADYSDGSQQAAAYGPLVVEEGALVTSGSPVSSLRVEAEPDVALATPATVRAAAARLDGATTLLDTEVGDRVRITRIASQLPATVERIEGQQTAGRATVLVAVLLGAALSLAALVLAGRLVASARDEERVLLVALGTSPQQQVAAAAGEGALLAVAAAVVAVPAASFLHAAVTRTGALSAAGLRQAPAASPGLVAVAVLTAAAVVPVLVATGVDTRTSSVATRRRWALARAGADLVLLAVAAGVAVLGWWQLRSQPEAATGRTDLVATLAPALCLGAVTVVAVRVAPLALHLGARLAPRSRSLVGPLAIQQAARRAHPGTAVLLVAASVAAATFGMGLRATWERSQADQADLRTGSDLTLTLPGPADTSELATLESAAARVRAAAASAVVDRPLALGRYVGGAGPAPRLVALDTTVAGALLRGRGAPGTTWAGIGEALSPGSAVTGAAFGDAVLLGRADTPLALTVTPTAVVQDAHGLRHPVGATAVALDGRPHVLDWDAPVAAGSSLVALSLRLDGPSPDTGQAGVVPVRIRIGLRGSGPLAAGRGAGDGWHVETARDSPVQDARVAVSAPATGRALVAVGADVDVTYLSYGGGTVLATAFDPPDAVPVAVSSSLASSVGTRVGGELAAVVGTAAVPLRVVAVVPSVPSAPGAPALLADTDTLSRALVAGGALDPVVDGWWFADPAAGAPAALRDLDLGTVRTRAAVTADLTRGPLQVTVPTALTLLSAASIALLWAGTAIVTGSDRRRRAAELTRLRALGLSRRGARWLLLGEQAAFLAPLVVVGAAVGALVTLVLGPLVVRSDLGAAPVPRALATWPWAQELLVLGVAVAGVALVTWVLTARQVHGSDTAGLRVGD
ncbi:ABC transporter permease [Nocardioides flavescens]|uniref:Permease n=1 Tax=Nocardioides flavescens TaxID=2691959 RepID=A0A6L7EVT1_9ACTN|nr:ABC transporter permease [Nocardioides flavescens]MXG88099.1 permease [Nocardioides flavescens]